MNKKVIYTAVFRHENDMDYFLFEPEINIDGYDFVCFTNNTNLKSNLWDIRIVPQIYSDGTRDARRYKHLPHRYLNNYDVSVWMDADVKLTKNPSHIINDLLGNYNLAVLNHELCGISVTGNMNVRKCIYEEARFIKWLGDNNPKKNYKDDMNTIQSQMERYIGEGYPKNNGLARTTVIFRNHNKDDIVKHSEDCWEEIKYGSKRDQLSFNYVAWKNNLKFNYIQEDIDNNEYFHYMKGWRQRQLSK
tara:strand:+ start:3589 stop:4329 length:741 start_codon:yes stop_codon:yes gene_type:complete